MRPAGYFVCIGVYLQLSRIKVFGKYHQQKLPKHHLWCSNWKSALGSIANRSFENDSFVNCLIMTLMTPLDRPIRLTTTLLQLSRQERRRRQNANQQLQTATGLLGSSYLHRPTAATSSSTSPSPSGNGTNESIRHKCHHQGPQK